MSEQAPDSDQLTLSNVLRQFKRGAAGALDTAGVMAGGMASTPLSGLAGLGSLWESNGDLGQAQQDMASVPTYQPQTEIGQRAAGILGQGAHLVQRAAHWLPEHAQDAGLGAVPAAIIATGLEGVPQLLGGEEGGLEGQLERYERVPPEKIPYEELQPPHPPGVAIEHSSDPAVGASERASWDAEKPANDGNAALANALRGQTPAAIDWAGMSPEEGILAAKAGVHLKPKKKGGGFVGGPEAATDMDAVEALRKKAFEDVKAPILAAEKLKKMQQEGEPSLAGLELGDAGGGWYSKDAALFNEIDPQNPKRSSRNAAIYSPQADPGTNMGWMVSNHNQLRGSEHTFEGMSLADALRETGEAPSPVEVDPPKRTAQALLAERNHTSQDWSLGGRKVDTFTLDTADPMRQTAQPTSDLHTGRANGYFDPDGSPFKRGFRDPEHGYVAGEVNMLHSALRDSGLPGPDNGKWTRVNQAQAVQWISSRVKNEITKLGHPRDTPLESFPPDVQAGILARAREGFADNASNFTANITREAIPSAKSGHLTEMPKAPEGLKQRYTDEALGKSGGYDPVLADLDFLQRRESEGLGQYQPKDGEMEFNPSRSSHPIVSYEKGPGGLTRLEPSAKKSLDLASSIHAFLNVQDAVPWHVVKTRGMPEGNALSLQFKEGSTAAEQKALYDRVAAMPEVNGKKPSLTNNGGGSYTLDLDYGGGTNGELSKALKGLPPELEPDPWGPTQERGNRIGNMKEMPWGSEQETGRATNALIDALRNASVNDLGSLDAGLRIRRQAGHLNDVDQRTHLENPSMIGPPREDVLRARDIIKNEGFSGLVNKINDVIKSGKAKNVLEAAKFLGLPAAAITALQQQNGDDK